MNLSKKQHLVLVAFAIAILNSCNYWVSKEEQKEKEKTQFTKRVELNKQQAELLVNTTSEILDVIDLCEDVENLSIEPETKEAIVEVKENQLELLDEIREASTSLMVSVPSYVDNLSLNEVDESRIAEKKLHEIEQKIKNQKQLLEQLKDNNTDNSIAELSDTLIPIVSENLEVITYITR